MEISVWAVVLLGVAFLAFVSAGVAIGEGNEGATDLGFLIGYVLSFLVACNIIYCNFDFGLKREVDYVGIGFISFVVTVVITVVLFVFAKGISNLLKDS